jgi:UDP-2,3-diacylglucosamine hydrolase
LMSYLFLSDVHLSARRPRIVDTFVAFTRRQARAAEAVYILGDLFDLWLGDDDNTDPHPEVLAALADLSGAGVAVYVTRGNHDFLLQDEFEARTGCTLLDDLSIVEIYGNRVLLMHGDTLCTDDVEYQAFRKRVRDPATQQWWLSLPLEERAHRAEAIRNTAKEFSRLKPAEIMDVNGDAVSGTMQAHSVRHLIHGHTHRPASHAIDIDGGSALRVVLGDWYDEDYVLEWTQEGRRAGRIAEVLGDVGV